MLPSTLKSAFYRSLAQPVVLRTGPIRDGVTILMFHGFRDGSGKGLENLEGKHLDGAAFERLISKLSQFASFLSLRNLLGCLERGEDPPRGAVVLTFDDGYESNHRVAFPILSRHRAPATVFLATEFVGTSKPLWTDRLEFALGVTRRDGVELDGVWYHLGTVGERLLALKAMKAFLKAMPQEPLEARVAAIEGSLGVALPHDRNRMPPLYRPLSRDQISEMSESGLVEFGGHTHTHRILGRCGREVAEWEIDTCRGLVEEWTARPCDLFCYPNGRPGDFDEVSEGALRRAGFRCALTTVPGRVRPSDNPFELRRLGVSDRESVPWTLLEISGVLPMWRARLSRSRHGEEGEP